MGILLDDRKVTAAARSMDQFYPVIRALYRAEVGNEVIEAATIFLYVRCAHAVFGRRFVERMDGLLADRLKYSTPPEMKERVERLTRLAEHYAETNDDLLESPERESGYEHRVRSLIRALMDEGGIDTVDPEIVRDAFVPMEGVLERIRAHLAGIKKQNHFLM